MLVPVFNTQKWRPLRAIVFVILGLSAGNPYVYAIYDEHSRGESYLPNVNKMILLYGGYVYITGAIMYAIRAPEKCFPKKFDLCGASH